MVEAIENQLSLICDSLKSLPATASQILDFCGETKILIFEGQLGAGKTTLIKELCKFKGVTDNTSSPTFAIINEYLDGADQPVYHFDFFRIRDEEEAMNIGCEEYFYSGHLCLVEWPSKVTRLIPSPHISILIDVTGEESRTFHLSKHD